MQGGHYVARVRVPVNQISSGVEVKQDSSHGRINGVNMENGQPEHPGTSAEPLFESHNDNLPVHRRECNMSACDGQWYYISDSNVKTSNEADVLKSQAYILFYERVPFV